jgi:hypothetical protein
MTALGDDADRLIAEIGERVAAGLHLDQVPGRAGEDLVDGGIPADYHRIYFRGTAEFAAALAAGKLDRLPSPPPPATLAAVEQAESLVGGPLPRTLKRLYLEVANGGFGPGYGVLGLDGGFTDDLRRTAIGILAERDDGSRPGMPRDLFPLCSWGCAIYSFVHCPSGRIIGWDPNPVEPEDDVPYFEQEYTIETWLAAWLEGTLQQPWLMVDERSGGMRGATAAETRAALAED